MTEIEEKQLKIRQGIDEIRELAKKPMTRQAAWNRLRQRKPELFTALDSPSGGLRHPYPQPTVGTQRSLVTTASKTVHALWTIID